mmetsp:Transcript_137447/g.383300  ORF Transcript_137447/g.383300 Transcript_137447/m.383300 type:complete len:212 (-) Transcript_137447:134-769(-)
MGQGMGQCCRDRCVVVGTQCDERLQVDAMEQEDIQGLVPAMSVLPPLGARKEPTSIDASPTEVPGIEESSPQRPAAGGCCVLAVPSAWDTAARTSSRARGEDHNGTSASSSSRPQVLQLPGRPTLEASSLGPLALPAVQMPTPWIVANESRITPTLLADWHQQDGGARGKGGLLSPLADPTFISDELPDRGELQPRTLSRMDRSHERLQAA